MVQLCGFGCWRDLQKQWRLGVQKDLKMLIYVKSKCHWHLPPLLLTSLNWGREEILGKPFWLGNLGPFPYQTYFPPHRRNGFVSFIHYYYLMIIIFLLSPFFSTFIELRIVAQSLVLVHGGFVVTRRLCSGRNCLFFFPSSTFCARVMGKAIVLSVTKNKQAKA